MQSGMVLLGLVFILIGAYALLSAFYPHIPSLQQLWPVAPLAAGLTLLISFFRTSRQETARVFWGVALALSGLFLFLITFTDQNYGVLATWWPAFVIIAGISFLALWLAEGLADWGALFLAIVGLVFGGAYMAVNLQLLGPNTASEIRQLWPALLIFAGLILVLRGTLGAKRKKT